jgi:hypothetical protein
VASTPGGSKARPESVGLPSRGKFLAVILLAFIVHWAGGGSLNLKLGYFLLNLGFT